MSKKKQDAALLDQLAMTGTMGNAFYANAREATADAVALLERAAEAFAGCVGAEAVEVTTPAFPEFRQ